MNEPTEADEITAKRTAVGGVPPIPTSLPPADVEQLVLAEPVKPRTKLRLFSILAALYLTVFIAALDTTVVSVAIPTISAELHSALGYVWIGGAYLLANAATSPIWAKCSDIWGRKVVLLLSVGLFAASSILAALSQNMAALIAGRTLQGVASGGITQLVSIIISDLFSVRQRSIYLGFVGFVWALAGATGPLVGGAFTDLASWRWCFWINLPVCGIAFALVFFFLDVHNPHTKFSHGIRAVDWLGTISILAVTLLILVGLDLGGVIFPWNSPKVILLIVFGTLSIAIFLYVEKRLAKYPLMPLIMFKDWSNIGIYLVTFSQSIVLVGVQYYMPLYFQSVKQTSPLRSGILLIPLILTQATTEILSGFIINKTGRYRESIWVGTVFMTLGAGLYILLGKGSSIAMIVGLEILGGIGPALLFQGPIIAVQNSVSQQDTAAATASMGFTRNVAMCLSVVLGGVVFQNSMDSRQSMLASAGLSRPLLEALSGTQAAANVGIVRTIQDLGQREVVLDAFAWSLKNMFSLYTGLAALGLFSSLFVKHRKLLTEHTETVTGIDRLTEAEKS